MLICVGLAVDYAAHIAHMFKDASERGQDSQVFSGRVSRMFFSRTTSLYMELLLCKGYQIRDSWI